MKVLCSPPDGTGSYYGDVVCIQTINDHLYFLLMLDDGSFREARCTYCKAVHSE